MPKQFSDSTKHSDISVESTNSVDYSSLTPLCDRLVGPDVPASSPSHRRSRSMLFTSCLVGVILAGGTSAVIAFRQFSLADIWRGRAQLPQPTLTMRGEQRLILRSSRGSSGAPIPLGLTVYGPAEGAVIIITGLLPGMELSNGIEVGVDRWEVPATEVSYAWIAPPDGFVGSALLTAELRLTDDSIADRQAIQLEWGPSSPPGFAKREEAAGPTPPVLTGERDLEKAAPIPSSPSLAPEQLDQQEVTVSSSPPVLTGESNQEQEATMSRWRPPRPARFEQTEESAEPTPPVLTGERDLEKAATIPSSPSLAPEQLDQQEVTVSSSPPVLTGERDLEKAAAIPSSPSLASSQFDREVAVGPPTSPSIAHKQISRRRPAAGVDPPRARRPHTT